MAQKFTHAPGPWKAGAILDDDTSATITDRDDNEIATVAGHAFAANARLIAAAPETAAERDRLRAVNADLLAALRELVSASDAYRQQAVERGHRASNECGNVLSAFTVAARAAIARAEGRS